MSLADIRTKSKKKPPRIVAYGGAGVGKTYFGSQMPNPIFVLTEDGMGTIYVNLLMKSWVIYKVSLMKTTNLKLW